MQEGRAFPSALSGWYRGVTVQASTIAPITALQFCANGILQKLIFALKPVEGQQNNNGTFKLSEVEMISAAAGAGAISAIAYSPVDLITIQQQKLEKGMVPTMKHIYNNYGLQKGIYRGFMSCGV